MDSIVISIGGSIVVSDEIEGSYFKKLNDLFQKHSKNEKIYIVVGGGKTARKYIHLGREIGLTEKILDELGIEATRLNAKFLTKVLENTNKEIPKTTDQAKKMVDSIVVMGGTNPGHSTDMVGAELAYKTNAAKYIIATNVDGIYTKDPNKFKDAEKISEIKIEDLVEKYGIDWKSAGKNIVIDGPALKLINKHRIRTFVLNGNNLDEIKNVLSNKKFNGTKIKI